jgi:hypothetical protein
VNEEARIQREAVPADRARVTPGPGITLEDLHVVSSREQVGGPRTETPLPMIAIRINRYSLAAE